MTHVMELVSRAVFGLASVVLMLIALALSIYSARADRRRAARALGAKPAPACSNRSAMW